MIGRCRGGFCESWSIHLTLAALHKAQAPQERKLRIFFRPSTWARERDCPVENEPLGTDYDLAVQRAEKILLPAFDSWLKGRVDANPIGIGVVIGTLDWMFHEYRRTWKQKTAKRLQPLSPGQCRVHETGIKMICEYRLKDGRRLGARRLSSIDTAFADDLVRPHRNTADEEGPMVIKQSDGALPSS